MIEVFFYNFYISFFITLTILVFVRDKITWKEGGFIASFLLIILIFLSCFIALALPSVIVILIIKIFEFALPGFIEYIRFTDLFVPIYLAFVISLLPLLFFEMFIKSLNISRLNKIIIELLMFVLTISLVFSSTLYYFSDVRITNIKLLELSLAIGVVFFIIDEATNNYKKKDEQ